VSPICIASNALFRLLEISDHPPIYATRITVATTVGIPKPLFPFDEDVGRTFSIMACVA